MKWKNSIAAPAITKRRLVILLQHILIWSIWYGLNSLILIWYRPTLTALHWVHLCYNFLSLVLVFYGTAFLVKPWFYAHSKWQFDPLYTPEVSRQRIGTAWWAVLAILVGYVALSVFIDRTFPIYETSTLLDHVDKRLNRGLPYVAAAIMYGHYRSQVQWYQELLAEAYAHIATMRQQYTQYASFAERLCHSTDGNSTDTLYQPLQWKKNIPVSAKNPFTTAALHIMLWAIWFGLHSLSLVVYGRTFTLPDWLLGFYDYGSLVLVFYGISFLMKKYFLYQKWHPKYRMTTRKWFGRLIRIELFAALAILISYIAISVYLNQRFPVNEFPVTSFEYTWQYFNYTLPYATTAILFSYFHVQAHLHQVRLDGLNFLGEKVIAEHNQNLFILCENLRNLSGTN